MSDNEQNDAAGDVDPEIAEEERIREESQQIWQCFMQFDVDQQGVISTSELKQALEFLNERVTEPQVFRMIADADPNNTGQLSFYQFK